MDREVLIITYYWPPSGGGGVQRWLKFVKYLPQFGFTPIVYTPSNPTAPAFDDALLNDVPRGLQVIRRPIAEPFGLYRLLTGKKRGQSTGAAFASETPASGWKERLANRIRSNFFIPDARLLWVRPSAKFLRRYLLEHPIPVIVTTGPPHSLHLIGLRLKRMLNVHWVADFRDPWTGIDFYSELLLSKWADRRHRKLEKEVLRHADLVLAVSPSNAGELRQKGAKRVEVITNGFDPADMETGVVEPDPHFSLAHIGTFMPNRNIDLLWDCLSELRRENAEFRKHLRLRFAGKTDRGVAESLRRYGLEDCAGFAGYISHADSVRMQKASRVLLLVINQTGSNRGMLTGKLYEYLASGRPILAIGPTEGDAAGILQETGCGRISDFDDRNTLRSNILHFFNQYLQGKNEPAGISPAVLKYSRRELTGQLAKALNGLYPTDTDRKA